MKILKPGVRYLLQNAVPAPALKSSTGLAAEALGLCWKVDLTPPGASQTVARIAASALHAKLLEYEYGDQIIRFHDQERGVGEVACTDTYGTTPEEVASMLVSHLKHRQAQAPDSDTAVALDHAHRCLHQLKFIAKTNGVSAPAPVAEKYAELTEHATIDELTRRITALEQAHDSLDDLVRARLGLLKTPQPVCIHCGNRITNTAHGIRHVAADGNEYVYCHPLARSGADENTTRTVATAADNPTPYASTDKSLVITGDGWKMVAGYLYAALSAQHSNQLAGGIVRFDGQSASDASTNLGEAYSESILAEYAGFLLSTYSQLAASAPAQPTTVKPSAESTVNKTKQNKTNTGKT